MNQAQFHRIIRAVSDAFRVDPPKILSRDRHHPIVQARFASMWLCRNVEEPRPSYPLIARFHNRTDHTQCMYACDWIDRKMRNDLWYAATMNSLRDQLSMKFQPDPHLTLVDTQVPPTQFIHDVDSLEVSITRE
jgi:chromosomal replication initiation ATPase DnaA